MKESKVKIKAYVIDEIKVDSSQHKCLKVFQKSSFSLFPTILAIKTNQKNQQVLQILAFENLSKCDISKIKTDSEKLKITFDILKSLGYLHQKQYFSGEIAVQQLLYYDNNSKTIKIKPFKSIPINQHKNSEVPKKEKIVIKNEKQLFNQYEKKPQYRDIWKWALFTAKLLFNFSVEKYFQKISNHDKEKINQFIPQISIKNQFINSQQFLKMLLQCLKPYPKKRPTIQQIIPIYEKIIINLELPFDQRYLSKAQKYYKQNESKYKSQFEVQIKQDLLLTDQLKKKITNQFVKNTQKPPKSFKPLYRASRVQFSTRVFYQSCSKKSKLLFIIDTQQSGIICCYIQPEININDSAGFSGFYVSDPSLKSFMFSPKSQQLFKLIIKDKAFKCVPGKGPIIGDGDIVLGDSKNNNQCNFPKSFQSGKTKKLTPKPKFSIKNYDVYEILF